MPHNPHPPDLPFHKSGSKPIAAHPLDSVASPKVIREILPNGLTLIEIIQPLLRTVHISAYVKTGSRFEAPGQNGISHFLEHMVFRGTSRYPTAFELNLAFEQLGANVNGSTMPDATEYSVSLPHPSAADGLSLLLQMITRPLFNEIDTERKIIAEEILEEFDEYGQCIDVDSLSRRRVFADSRLGAPITGSVDNVMAIGYEELTQWFKENYTAGNMVVCVSGAISDETIKRELRDLLGTVPKGKRHSIQKTHFAFHDGKAVRYQHVHKPGSQTLMRLAFGTPGLAHPDYPVVEILLRLIDDGMSTPLHRTIFEDLALAYNVGAELEAYEDSGVFNIDAQASHENIAAIVKETLQILVKLTRGDIAEQDLVKAKRRATWDLEALQDFPGALNSWYGEQELYRNALSPEMAATRIAAIKKDDIVQIARKVFSRDTIFLTTVGNQSEKRQQLLARQIDDVPLPQYK
ncbi:MAG: insulinase family protein [Deltaproteobacteria bacterium]|nr:insulinase family protein [Deltaproteobacteria bacterium]